MMDSCATLGRLALEMIKGDVQMTLKPDGTKVTTVDIALNDEFIWQVAADFPDDLVWGEEASNSKKYDLEAADQHWMWTLDPIDGTTGFWRSYQNKNFSDCGATNLIAGFAPSERSPTLSVVHNPFQKQIMTISANPDGVFYQSSSMAAPRATRLAGDRPARLDDVRRFEQNSWPGAVPDLSSMRNTMPSARRVKHQLFMASVALGDSDLAAFPGPSNPHDVAPAAHICNAAGATVMSLVHEKYDDIDWRVPVAGVVAAATPELAREFVESMAA